MAKNKPRYRVFEMIRVEDLSGVSGTGIVAQGMEFDDGQCVIRWLTDVKATAIYKNIQELESIHGHKGRTKIFFKEIE